MINQDFIFWGIFRVKALNCIRCKKKYFQQAANVSVKQMWVLFETDESVTSLPKLLYHDKKIITLKFLDFSVSFFCITFQLNYFLCSLRKSVSYLTLYEHRNVIQIGIKSLMTYLDCVQVLIQITENHERLNNISYKLSSDHEFINFLKIFVEIIFIQFISFVLLRRS